MRALPDYSTLALKGNGHTQDSFSLAVQAAAGLLGEDVDYETVFCLSGNAFAPAIDRGEDCTAWWHVQGWQADEAMETVAGVLGLHAERLELPADGLSAADSPEEFARKASIARKKSAAILRTTMDRGAVVITDGGWRIQMPEGFTPWCWWGIVTGATDGGDLRGACLGAHPGKELGFRDRPLDYVGGSWAISPGAPVIRADTVDAVVLQQAVARIRGTGRYAATERSAYGLEAMDAWTAQMARVPFCTACAHAGPPGMAGCAVNNAQTTLAGATTAAAYLRRRAPSIEELFERLNRSLHGALERHTFVCLTVGELDLATRARRVSNYGCPYPYHCRASTSQLAELQMAAYPLGIQPDATYGAVEAQLEPGDRVVFVRMASSRPLTPPARCSGSSAPPKPSSQAAERACRQPTC